jgi:hypothetical protein
MNKRNQLNALQELLSQLKIHDPGIRKLIEQLSNKSYKGDEQKEIIRRLRIQNKKLIQQVALLKERLLTAKEDRLKVLNNVSHIKKLNASLAEALGSCSICWGEDPSCTSCKGKGIAGWRKINRRYFNIYVLSGLETLYEQETM